MSSTASPTAAESVTGWHGLRSRPRRHEPWDVADIGDIAVASVLLRPPTRTGTRSRRSSRRRATSWVARVPGAGRGALVPMVEAGVRTSTEDKQSPEDSRRWQLDLATRLVAPAGGQIVATYHDIDVSRAGPWSRRPETTGSFVRPRDPGGLGGVRHRRAATGLLGRAVPVRVPAPVALRGRAVGSGARRPGRSGQPGPRNGDEPVRRLVEGRTPADPGPNPHAMLAPVPPGGGSVDARITGTARRHRPAPTRNVRRRPREQAAGARTRSGRCADGPSHLRDVRHRHGVPVDRQILEGEGMPSPGEIGPTRHPRSAGVWAGSAVRATLTDPRYLGQQVAGRQRRQTSWSTPPTLPLGTDSRQRWQAAEGVGTPTSRRGRRS